MKESDVLREYDLVIKDQLKKGIVERVFDVNSPCARKHYMIRQKYY